jgi:hypothetical protein
MNYKLDSVKLEFERIYKEYCNTELDNQENDKWIPMLKEFVNFRADLSGGIENQYSESMVDAEHFLNEICLFDDLMSDWAGCYRGDYKYETYEALMKIINNSTLPAEVKYMVQMGYVERNELELE